MAKSHKLFSDLHISAIEEGWVKTAEEMNHMAQGFPWKQEDLNFICSIHVKKPSTLVHAYNHSTEAETGGSL